MHVGFSWITQYVELLSYSFISLGGLVLLLSFLTMMLSKQNKPRSKGVLIGILVGLLAGAGSIFLISDNGYVRYDAQIKSLQKTANQAYLDGQNSILRDQWD